ncbi:hypothetical protein [Streptomyces brasiliensis]|uniref:Protein kinase domain-containing protein n=1 Tax=Streptomyces brasiliensis TaxID=1954 RepID=A0A917NIU2_9ACTN|nr:hypothetical protein [Streptomyces brasiliensis]GGJ00999.1 hypothetical protein GCM10010121_009240 [Streptomyces brasiliensis]
MLDLSAARSPGPAPTGLGTFCCRSPEQARGEPLTAADLWDIGMALFEVAGGAMPFDFADSRDESYDGVGRYPPPERTAPPIASRRRMPAPLAAVVDACLQGDAAARPTVAELRATLSAASV